MVGANNRSDRRTKELQHGIGDSILTVMTQDDVWQPPLHPKGVEIVNDDHRYLLVTGPKKSSKTISICHKVAKHLYEVDNAHVGVLVKRQENARVGVWPDLTEFVVERIWQQQAGVLPYHNRPKVTDTKRRVFSVYNAHRGISRATLVTVFRESEIEQLLKNTRFSLIYINEADQFPEQIFSAAADQLRMEHMGVPTGDHRLILDCNPAPEGEKHWLYSYFMDSDGKDSAWRRDYHVIRVTLEDNPWLSQKEMDDLVARYRPNPRMYARYVMGDWVPSSDGSLFEDVFDELKHVVGERLAGRPSSQWPILLPPKSTNELILGWDLGESNHSVVFFTKRWYEGKYCYDILEDITSVSRAISIRQFTQRVVQRLDFWLGVLRRNGAELITVRHWSDPSAFLHRSTGGNKNTHALEVLIGSNNRIHLRPVRKGPGSVAARVSMMTSLLMDGRILFSVLAENVINAMIGLKPGPGSKAIAKAPTLIHSFDAATYGLSGEIGADLEDETDNEHDPRVMTVAKYI